MKKYNKQAEFCFALYALLANQSSWKNISFDGYLKIVVTVDELYCISICLVLFCFIRPVVFDRTVTVHVCDDGLKHN